MSTLLLFALFLGVLSLTTSTERPRQTYEVFHDEMLKQCIKHNPNAEQIITDANNNTDCLIDGMRYRRQVHATGNQSLCGTINGPMMTCLTDYMAGIAPCLHNDDLRQDVFRYLSSLSKFWCENMLVEIEVVKAFENCNVDTSQNYCELKMDFDSKLDRQTCGNIASFLQCYITPYKDCDAKITKFMQQMYLEPLNATSCQHL